MIYAERADVSTADETVAQIWWSLLLTLGFMGGGGDNLSCRAVDPQKNFRASLRGSLGEEQRNF